MQGLRRKDVTQQLSKSTKAKQMKITAHEEYGLRIILRLARLLQTSSSGLVSINEIASAEAISYENTAAIIGKLKEAGLVESTRGKYGGYKLSRPSPSINLYQIIDALGEASFGIDFCNKHSGKEENCVNSNDCSVRPVWSSLNSMVNNFLAGISLNSLLNKEENTINNIRGQVRNFAEVQMSYN